MDYFQIAECDGFLLTINPDGEVIAAIERPSHEERVGISRMVSESNIVLAWHQCYPGSTLAN